MLSNGKPSVIIGDMNFPCAFNNEGFSQCHNVLLCYRVFHCDEFINSGNCITCCNHSLNQFSFLDHMFVSDSIRQDILHASLEFNVTKSQCVVIGKMCKSELMPMNLNCNDVIWCDTIKYLCVHLQSDRCVKFNISHTKINFYAAWRQ